MEESERQNDGNCIMGDWYKSSRDVRVAWTEGNEGSESRNGPR